MKWSTDWDLSTIPDVFLLSEMGKRLNRRRINRSNGGNLKYKGTSRMREITEKGLKNGLGRPKKDTSEVVEVDKSKREKYGWDRT